MGATITNEGAIKVVRLTGMLRKAELDEIQWGEARRAEPDGMVNVLVIAEAFEGWQRGDNWGDVSFITTHGDKIGKIALVAETRWKDRLLMFTGAGFRRTQVKFFPVDQLDEARAWLEQPAPATPQSEAGADLD